MPGKMWILLQFQQLIRFFFNLIWQFTRARKENFFTLYKKRGLTHYINIDPLAVGKFLYYKHFNKPAKVKKYYAEGLKLLQKTKKSTDYWQKNLTYNYSLENFQKAYKDFRTGYKKINYDFSVTPWLAIEYWQREFERILPQLIQKNSLEARGDQIFISANRPWKNTALIEIQEKFRKGISLKKIVKNYQFLRSWVAVFYRSLNKKWFSELKIINKESKKAQIISQTQLLKLLKPSKKNKKVFKNAPYVIFFKDWRDDVRRKFAYQWSFLFELLCKKFKLQDLDIGFLTLDEIQESLKKGQIDKQKINWRKRHPFVVTNKKESIEVEVKKGGIKKYLSIIKKIEKGSKRQEIFGVTAQSGKVRGKVFIIKTFHDIKRVKEGNILVANTTHPNYLPAMRKASAFITNEGGIISHAAIISRELKKPCIVGTKIATKILKDGDIVEVDATRGTVKVLKK